MDTLAQSLEMSRGDSRSWLFAVTDGYGSTVDISGHRGMWFTGKRSISDPDASAIFQKVLPSGATSSATTGILVSSLTAGAVTLSLVPIDTSGLEDAILQLSFDVQYVDSAARKYTVAGGKLIVRPDVTRA